MRKARARCESGIYHIVLRGINRQDIFYDEEDYQRFIETVGKIQSDSRFALYAYCLMSNHIHILIKENSDTISRIMSRIGSSYAWWYNNKYGRCGHVFQGRFGSEGIENDEYFLTVLRYIHNNPVKAGIVGAPEYYCWSSMRFYIENEKQSRILCETSFVLDMFDQDSRKAIVSFREFMRTDNNDECLENDAKHRRTDSEIKLEIENLMNGEPIGRIQGLERARRNEILRSVKALEGVSLRQIARVTGLSVDIIFKA